MGYRITDFIILIIFLFSASVAYANIEKVYVAKIMDNDDKAIIVRNNGDAYMIEKGIGCLSLWRYEGKMVLINSPSLFLGIGARLIILDSNQDCKIWDSKFIGQWDSLSFQKRDPVNSQAPDVKKYVIEAAYNDEIFVINGETYKAKTCCFNMMSGDPVIFLEGSPLGACASAIIYNLRTQKECRCWCE